MFIAMVTSGLRITLKGGVDVSDTFFICSETNLSTSLAQIERDKATQLPVHLVSEERLKKIDLVYPGL